MKSKVLIITGFGLNCQEETQYAFSKAGASMIEKVHLNDIIAGKKELRDYNILALIGGFSYGDHISAGKVMAVKLRHALGDQLKCFVDEGNLVLGICNGFQELMKLGLLPSHDGQLFRQTATITENICGHFYDGWVNLKVNSKSPSVFTRGMSGLHVPVRHGEGRIIFDSPETMEAVVSNNQVVFQYADGNGNPTEDFPANPNGTTMGIAGLSDPTGRIMGMMPHPEAYIDPWLRPGSQSKEERNEGEGLTIFKNAVSFVRENL